MSSLLHSLSPSHPDPDSESKPSESDVGPGTALPHAKRFKAAPKAPSNPITIFPLQRRFAVIQVDPVAMVLAAGLGDAEALTAAKALVTKKYLVYLESVSPSHLCATFP